MIKLNLGSGSTPRKGFINVDNYVDGKGITKADIRKLPFDDNFADYVEMFSVLEHIPFREVPFVLKEVRRVMKPNAELVILTDNFDGIAIDWIRANMAGSVGEDVMETLFGNQNHEGEFHKSAFNPELLHNALGSIGFREIIIKNIPQNSPIPAFGELPAQPDKFIKNDQLYAKAVK